MLFGRSILMRHCILKYFTSFSTLIVTVLLIHSIVGQDIVFPDDNLTDVFQRENENRETTTTSTTTTTTKSTLPPIVCGESMINFNETEEFCECREGYLYYAKHDNCYKQYTRGPCDIGKYFILRSNDTRAKCRRNPCQTENEVPYKGSCHGLLLPGGPCAPHETLVVSEKFYEPACESIGTESYNVIIVPLRSDEPCPPGSRRAGRGLCRMIM